MLVAIVGLALAVGQPHIAAALEPPPPPEPRQKLSDVLAEAGEKLVDRMLDKARRKPAGRALPASPIPAQGRPWPFYVSAAATALGFIGALAGTAGWIRR